MSAAGAPSAQAPAQLRVLAFNIAKCFAYTSPTTYSPKSEVQRCLDQIGALIRKERADVVFLNEIVFECGPRPLNQVRYLARASALPHWAYSDNFRFGLPFFRIRAGNAILSRYPMKNGAVQQLVGGPPFYKPTNNRRLLWVDLLLGETTLRAGSVRNDSYSLKNNHAQALQILKRLAQRPESSKLVLLGGDFNAEPHNDSIQAFMKSGRFTAALQGPPTFPAENPRRKIDLILAPAAWRLLEHRTVDSKVSDHLAIVSVFALSGSLGSPAP